MPDKERTYKIIGLAMPAGGEVSRTTSGAPTMTTVASFARSRRSRYAARYYPNLKVWRVFDISKPKSVARKNGRSIYTWPVAFETETEDAAFMFMVLHQDAP